MILAFLLFVFGVASVCGQSPALIEKSQHGMDLMAQKKFEEAIPVYRQLSQAVPNHPGLLLNLGMALHLAGHSRQAIPPLESATKLDASIAPAWLFLGAAYLGTGEPARAVRPLKRYAKLQPDDPNAHQTLGDALLATSEFHEAAAEYRKLSELDSNSPRAWFGLNRSYDALAQAAFMAIEKSAPESAWWLVLVADERMVRRQYRSAFFFYRKAEALQPDLGGLHASIAEVYKASGHVDWAEAELQKEKGPDCATPESSYCQSRTFARMAREAFAHLEQMPEGAEIHELRAGLLRVRRQHLEAVQEWRLALKYAPDDPHLEEELLSSLYQARDYQAALALVDELLRKDPTSPLLNFTKGDILLSRQETEKALSFLKGALKADPKLVAAHHALGRAYMLVSQPVAAIPHLRAALPLDEDGSLRYQLSKAYQATGQAELAKKMLVEYQERQKADREEKQKLEQELQITAP